MPVAGVLSQMDIENEIIRLANLLEDATDALGTALQEEANADADWSIAEARTYHGFDGPEWKARAHARETHEQLYRDHKVKGAAAEHLKEKCRQLRGQLDAVRTLSANVRVQT